MFIRFTLPQLFRLRSRKAKTQPQPQPKPQPIPPQFVIVQVTTTTSAPALPPKESFPASYASDPITTHPCPNPARSSLSASSSSDAHPPLIVIDNDADAGDFDDFDDASTVCDETEPMSLKPDAVPVPSVPVSSKLTDDSSLKLAPRIAVRPKTVQFTTSPGLTFKSSPESSFPAMPMPDKAARRTTMGANVTRRNSKRETKIEFKRNSRGEVELMRKGKREAELEFLRGEYKPESKVGSKRGSIWSTKRASKAPSVKKEKRQSRWEREINDPDTQEVLRVLSALP